MPVLLALYAFSGVLTLDNLIEAPREIAVRTMRADGIPRLRLIGGGRSPLFQVHRAGGEPELRSYVDARGGWGQ